MSSLFDRSLLDYLTASSVARLTGTLGVLLTGVALLLLAERQLLSAGDPGRRRRARVIDAVVAPMLVAFLVVVVVRFQRLST